MTTLMDGLVGRQLRPSAWQLISQEMVDTHARNTGDDDWLHTDPIAAAEGPSEGTIAQGSLLLSLLAGLHYGALPELETHWHYVMNYGFDRVRFVRPVRTGTSVQAVTRITEVKHREDGRSVIRLDVRLLVNDDDSRPAVVADWLFLAAPRDRR
jgi:acyl dehydratase